MQDLPIMLKVRGSRCVIVGGGSVARRRAAALLAAGATVVVIAPQVDADLAELPIEIVRRGYQSGDLAGAKLVVIASDDPAVNDAVAVDAERLGVLTNRADRPSEGDVMVPAHAHHGPITVAVHTGGISAQAAAVIRRELSDALDPDWVHLLETVAPFRQRVQDRIADSGQRQNLLRKLTGDQAKDILKSQGIDALRQFCENLLAYENGRPD